MQKYIYFLFCCWVTPVSGGGLPNGEQELSRLLSRLTSFSAGFSQSLYDANQELVQKTTGTLKAAQPDRLHWQTESPMEQLIVADGEQIWVYDPDLEQVIVQRYPEELAKTPAMLLIGQTQGIAEQYQVFIDNLSGDSTTEEGEQTAFILIPKDSQNLYTRLTITLIDGVPGSMHLEDTLQQTTVIDFAAVVTNQNIEPSWFEFSVPAGADLIRND